MKKIIIAFLIFIALPADVASARVGPSPSPGCVLVVLRGYPHWLCPAYPAGSPTGVHRSIR